MTAAVLTCQLQCLNNPSWREESSFIHSVWGQMGPALLSHSSWSLSNPFSWLITGKSNNWDSQSSAECWSSASAPAEQLKDGRFSVSLLLLSGTSHREPVRTVGPSCPSKPKIVPGNELVSELWISPGERSNPEQYLGHSISLYRHKDH